MSQRQRQRVVSDCFRLHLPADTSTDGGLTVNYRQGAGKKMHQRKRTRAERTRSQ